MYWWVDHILEVRNIVVSEFKSQPKVVRAYSEIKNLQYSVKSYNQFYCKEQAEKIEVIKLPPSKQVIIRNSNEKNLYFIFKSTTSKLMYELSDYYGLGINLVSREERFKKLFLVYEELELNPDDTLKAIRHSFSHSRSSLNQKKTTMIMEGLFGDKKIDLKKYKHNRIFQNQFSRLVKATTGLYLRKVFEYMELGKNFEHFYIN